MYKQVSCPGVWAVDRMVCLVFTLMWILPCAGWTGRSRVYLDRARVTLVGQTVQGGLRGRRGISMWGDTTVASVGGVWECEGTPEGGGDRILRGRLVC